LLIHQRAGCNMADLSCCIHIERPYSSSCGLWVEGGGGGVVRPAVLRSELVITLRSIYEHSTEMFALYCRYHVNRKSLKEIT